MKARPLIINKLQCCFLEGTGLPLSLTSPKKNTKKAQEPPNPKIGAKLSGIPVEPELHQIAVNCTKYNQI
jgi:hypothetical protein